MTNEFILEIDKRYSDLAESSCCLSCGNASLFAKPAETEIVVDLGSGRGEDVLKMALEVGENGFAYGIDISDKMIEKANKQKQKLGIENAAFIESELTDIKLPNNLADLVISNCTINHSTDKKKTWSEIYRILKPGGRFVISDIYSTEPVPTEYASDPTAVAECWAGAVTKETYLQTLSDTGFKDVKILEESKPYPKGKINLSSFTICGWKKSCCCQNK